MFYLEINNCFLLLILTKMMTLNSPDGNENPAALRLEMLQIKCTAGIGLAAMRLPLAPKKN